MGNLAAILLQNHVDSRHLYTQDRQNGMQFGKVIVKIKWCNVFASQRPFIHTLCRKFELWISTGGVATYAGCGGIYYMGFVYNLLLFQEFWKSLSFNKVIAIGWWSTFYRATACNATHGIAVGILSVCLSVRPSVHLYCDKTKQRTANILIPHGRAITLVFWHQQWLVGDAPFPLKSALKVTHPIRKTPTSTDFRS